MSSLEKIVKTINDKIDRTENKKPVVYKKLDLTHNEGEEPFLFI